MKPAPDWPVLAVFKAASALAVDDGAEVKTAAAKFLSAVRLPRRLIHQGRF